MFTFRLLVFSTIVTLMLLTPILAPIFTPIGIDPYDVQYGKRMCTVVPHWVWSHHITVTVTGLYDTENVMKDSGIDDII